MRGRGAIATFDYAQFSALYPEFQWASPATVEAWWTQAGTLYLRNDGTGPCSTAAIQGALLNLMTAHLLFLHRPQGAGASTTLANPIVGRINTATEGSVSVGAENQYPPGSAQWYQQSRYGADFYAATAAYRTAVYIPPNGHGVGGLYGAGAFPGGQVGGVGVGGGRTVNRFGFWRR